MAGITVTGAQKAWVKKHKNRQDSRSVKLGSLTGQVKSPKTTKMKGHVHWRWNPDKGALLDWKTGLTACKQRKAYLKSGRNSQQKLTS